MESRSYAHHFLEHNIPGFFEGVTNLPYDVLDQPNLSQLAALPRPILRALRQSQFDRSLGDGHRTASGPEFRNPKPAAADAGADVKLVIYSPSQKMDHELELAAIIGKPLPMRQRLKARRADEHIFGFALLNDWSARDIQGFEMTPLGPFNGKSVGTTMSPWIVTLDTLEPFKVMGQPQSPVPAYLEDPNRTTYSIRMQAEIVVEDKATVMGVSRMQSMYWTTRQMVAHAWAGGGAAGMSAGGDPGRVGAGSAELWRLESVLGGWGHRPLTATSHLAWNLGSAREELCRASRLTTATGPVPGVGGGADGTSRKGRKAIARILADGGTDVRAQDRFGLTAMAAASRLGHEATRLLRFFNERAVCRITRQTFLWPKSGKSALVELHGLAPPTL
ncbi:hypothetical protein ACJZ2D_015688 [Fusarium nematophilum]